VVSTEDAAVEGFCPSVIEPSKDSRRILRATDRSRRATNPGNFDAKGRVRKGIKRWNRSKRYQVLAVKRRERDRRLAAERKRAHGELANPILEQGTTIKTEKLSYKSFQKNFGRSVKLRAPRMLVSTLRRKAEGAGGGVIEINTRQTRLSQFDHTTGEYIKKPLSQRIHGFGDGATAPVQRDLYSAFLATCCATNTLDICQVEQTWPAAEPLLRRAMSRLLQPASGKGFARPHVPCVGVGRRRRGMAVQSRPWMS
jgi:putative transposase